MAMVWTCPCGALNGRGDRACGACGESRAGHVPLEPEAPRSRRLTCDCGASLLASGLCSATGGYPATSSCPLACPICRGPLAWDGGCERCHGCTTGRREDWAFPGDRYELDKGHWQRVDGPRKACTPEQNAAGFAAIRTILGVDVAHPSPSRHGLAPIDPSIREKLRGT